MVLTGAFGAALPRVVAAAAALCTALEAAEEEVTHPGVGDSCWVTDLAEGGANRGGLGKVRT